MKAFLLSLAAALFLASPAWANWATTAAGTVDDCSFSRRNRVCYFNQSDATTDSAILDARSCASVTFELNADIDVDSSGGGVAGAEVYLWRCSSSTISVNSCNRVFSDAGNVTLNGDATVGRSAIYGAVAPFFFIEVSANAASDSYRVTATCESHPR